ncbi:uncharacterized protein N7459_006343 [Penicillium hispanicum]|uniref:uncharacterized protein n=1 Tax=Penicillium hispanicum TaxID=1080232 RepID=UPI00254054F7|nr:uncharacterized protein N7459_006343 [Penicillium hispanicum]KAJ5577379.1 hypothetical protein N7459_006343 [Penicillium hispanicum]
MPGFIAEEGRLSPCRAAPVAPSNPPVRPSWGSGTPFRLWCALGGTSGSCPAAAAALVPPVGLCPRPCAGSLAVVSVRGVLAQDVFGAVPSLPSSGSRGGGVRRVWCVAVTIEARGPLGPRRRWSLWTDGRWPRLTPRFREEAALREPPFAGVSVGSGPSTRGPYAAASPRPSGRPGWNTCARTGAEGLSGGNWMVVRASPGTPGLVPRPGAACAPS